MSVRNTSTTRHVDTKSFKKLATSVCEQNAKATLKRLLINSQRSPNAGRREILRHVGETANLNAAEIESVRDWQEQCNSGHSQKDMASVLIAIAKLGTWEQASDSLQEVLKQYLNFDDGSPTDSTHKWMQN